jgi:DNA-binding response OmpR family regulator
MNATRRLPQKTDEGRFRILVVEDDLNVARLIMANLAKIGCDCRHACDGELALRTFAHHDPHMVLLDLLMPRLNGLAVCLRLRRESAVPIIVVTARDEIEDQVQAFHAGADDYITKPFEVSLLMARVTAQLRRAYRYGGAVSANGAAKPVGLPSGWATCESCDYAGPGPKFRGIDTQGHNLLRCPHCHSASHVAFAVR